ncbi:MAG: cupin domain-containing protein [Anaerolineae bacterium]|nr:cupin domain-containing protein [Anaerolineae bacterium]
MEMTIIDDTMGAAQFAADRPVPSTVFENARTKVVVGAVHAGQRIPSHPEALAVYYFLQGEGWMTVNGERAAVRPGMTVVTPEGSLRGMEAESDIAFLAVRVAPLDP